MIQSCLERVQCCYTNKLLKSIILIIGEKNVTKTKDAEYSEVENLKSRVTSDPHLCDVCLLDLCLSGVSL